MQKGRMARNVCIQYFWSNLPLKVIRQSLSGVAILAIGLAWLDWGVNCEERRGEEMRKDEKR